jgi:hypothetical protein
LRIQKFVDIGSAAAAAFGVSPARTTGDMLEQAVTAFGTQRGLQRGAQADVGRELALRSRSGMPRNAPSVQGTLTATSSWVVPQAEADRGQHRGGGTYQNPRWSAAERYGGALASRQLGSAVEPTAVSAWAAGEPLGTR